MNLIFEKAVDALTFRPLVTIYQSISRGSSYEDHASLFLKGINMVRDGSYKENKTPPCYVVEKEVAGTDRKVMAVDPDLWKKFMSEHIGLSISFEVIQDLGVYSKDIQDMIYREYAEKVVQNEFKRIDDNIDVFTTLVVNNETEKMRFSINTIYGTEPWTK